MCSTPCTRQHTGLRRASACDGTTAEPGGLLLVVTRKCHELVFEGEVTFLNGPRVSAPVPR